MAKLVLTACSKLAMARLVLRRCTVSRHRQPTCHHQQRLHSAWGQLGACRLPSPVQLRREQFSEALHAQSYGVRCLVWLPLSPPPPELVSELAQSGTQSQLFCTPSRRKCKSAWDGGANVASCTGSRHNRITFTGIEPDNKYILGVS